MRRKVEKNVECDLDKANLCENDHGFSKITHFDLVYSTMKLYQKMCDIYIHTHILLDIQKVRMEREVLIWLEKTFDSMQSSWLYW